MFQASSMAEANNGSLHIVMFPWLAFGHILPFLQLSKCLAQRGHRVSLVSTPRNIQRLPKLPPNLSTLLNLVSFPLPQVDNLRQDAEATSDLPYDEVQYLKKAFDGLDVPFAGFLETSTPDWIIYDFAPHWLPPIAAKLDVPCVFFSIFNASALAFFGPPEALINGQDSKTEPEHFTVPPEWIPFPSNLAFRLHEILRIFDSNKENVSGVSDSYRYGSMVQGCDFVAVRSCNEFEGEFLQLDEQIFRKPVVPVGLLPPSLQESEEEEEEEKWIPIRDWLQKHESRSVVYVAFGSEATLSQEEMTELALGLELSELPFFWVLRRPPGLDKDGSESDILPTGFEDRVKGRGTICRSWVPQLRILAHPSVGGFLTHCGWSSVIECLGLGLPMVILPLTADQGLNARGLEWKKIGLAIPRNETDGSFTRKSVAESLRFAVVDEEGESLRRKVKENKEIFGDKERHERYVDEFERYMKEYRRLR